MQKFLDGIGDFFEKFVPKALMKYVRRFLTVQFVLFVTVGVINTFNTAVIATVLDAVKNRFFVGAEYIERYNITFVTGYVLSMIISFFLNTYITFREKPTWKKFIKFPLSYIPNFLIQYVCVALFASLGLNNTIAYMIAALIGIPVTFMTMKILVYKSK